MSEPVLLESGIDIHTQSIYCCLCKVLLEKDKKPVANYVVSEWHHWVKQYIKGTHDVDKRGKTLPTFIIPPRQTLIKVGIQTYMHFCIPCFDKLFGTPKEQCGSCNIKVDKNGNHSTATYLLRRTNSINSHMSAEFHHDCLPYIFSAVKIISNNQELLYENEARATS